VEDIPEGWEREKDNLYQTAVTKAGRGGSLGERLRLTIMNKHSKMIRNQKEKEKMTRKSDKERKIDCRQTATGDTATAGQKTLREWEHRNRTFAGTQRQSGESPAVRKGKNYQQ